MLYVFPHFILFDNKFDLRRFHTSLHVSDSTAYSQYLHYGNISPNIVIANVAFAVNVDKLANAGKLSALVFFNTIPRIGKKPKVYHKGSTIYMLWKGILALPINHHPSPIITSKDDTMSKRNMKMTICGLLGLGLIYMTGCAGMSGPSLGILSFPIPVSPDIQTSLEDRFEEQKRYDRLPILEPIMEANHIALDEPSDDMVMRHLEEVRKTTGTIPYLDTTYRNNIKIVKELIADYVDEPRFYPGVGPAQLHHVHYKCTVYFSEVSVVGWPAPHTLKTDDAIEVLYIDLDHLHRVGQPEASFH